MKLDAQKMVKDFIGYLILRGISSIEITRHTDDVNSREFKEATSIVYARDLCKDLAVPLEFRECETIDTGVKKSKNSESGAYCDPADVLLAQAVLDIPKEDIVNFRFGAKRVLGDRDLAATITSYVRWLAHSVRYIGRTAEFLSIEINSPDWIAGKIEENNGVVHKQQKDTAS